LGEARWESFSQHVRHGTRVALKTLPTVEGQELHRFKREFRSLADLNHPNLVGLHTLQADAGQWFFTMDLVDVSWPATTVGAVCKEAFSAMSSFAVTFKTASD
jgi:hypothetical protein